MRVHEALGGVSEELADLGVALDQAEQRTEYTQARASAIDRLVELGILDIPGLKSGDAPPQQLADEDDSQVVDERLAALKGQVGLD